MNQVRRFFLLFVVLSWAIAPAPAIAQAQAAACVELHKKFDSINTATRLFPSNWGDVQRLFGVPSRVEENKPYTGLTSLLYEFSGCPLEFRINSEGKVASKNFKLQASALAQDSGASGRQPLSVFDPIKAKAAVQGQVPTNGDPSEMANAVVELRATLRQLQGQLSQLDRLLERQLASPGAPSPSASAAISSLEAAPAPATAGLAATTAPEAVPTTLAPAPGCAENGSCYGDISAATGRPKTVPVQGYYRQDGTYVRGHYRSAPSRR
jgi:hypothetical protein